MLLWRSLLWVLTNPSPIHDHFYVLFFMQGDQVSLWLFSKVSIFLSSSCFSYHDFKNCLFMVLIFCLERLPYEMESKSELSWDCPTINRVMGSMKFKDTRAKSKERHPKVSVGRGKPPHLSYFQEFEHYIRSACPWLCLSSPLILLVFWGPVWDSF